MLNHSQLGWSEQCCICGADVVSYNNPDPIRDGACSCCNDCNQLVREARLRIFRLPDNEKQPYMDDLKKMSYLRLKEELFDNTGT